MNGTKTIVVAMSGGVDSSTTATRLREEGYRVVGVTLAMGRKCDKRAIDDAQKVSEYIGIKHQVLDVSGPFRENVVDYFINSYLNGITPNPCAVCNRTIKFKELVDFMHQIGADYVATGHYANIVNNNGKYELHKAICQVRDQSYFLSTLKYEYLQYIKFPLGNETSKSNVREYARNSGLHVAEKDDSQDVCFIETNYRDFIINNAKYAGKFGLIKHVNGEVLGEHGGIINYTIGQRKGLGISYKDPIYVVRIDVENNIVYVGGNEDLYSNTVKIYNMNVLAEIDENKEYTVKLRSANNGQPGKIKLGADNTATVVLNEKTRAITTGQLCCLYDGTKVIADGWIK
ncbi:MAG: tRNA 2-thiouridine(34) synthase MnmA [Rickettsiales bacterium]|jgi:tRNA-specific 2-thiouridylase|nr:tRNA 2-thiouridine(34) synthase MnmA [Rickettsiales bacterium]